MAEENKATTEITETPEDSKEENRGEDRQAAVKPLPELGDDVYADRGPGMNIDNPVKAKLKGALGAKEQHAYSLIKWCGLVILLVFAADAVLQYNVAGMDKAYSSAVTDKVLEIAKYVVSAALGFFFGTTKTNGQDKN